jgi:hypothetical protein
MKEGGRNQTKEQSSQALADRPARRGGLSARATRTVCQCTADCLHRYDGPSGLGRGLSIKANRTPSSEPRKMDRPRGARDCPPGTCGPSARCGGLSEITSNQNSKPKRIEREAEQEHEEHATNCTRADRPPTPRGLSALHGKTQKQPDLEGQLLQSITGSPKR